MSLPMMNYKHIRDPIDRELPCYLCARSNRGFLLHTDLESSSYFIPVCPQCARSYDLGRDESFPEPPSTPQAYTFNPSWGTEP